ncbi:unnamed protein product [Chilo suppressalis]|uniref:Methyltransferase type 11 domain-containing protein n=1 Tax=Chilo suppressalis TaxID=168631 RepID=A0ABN8AZ13_CHISP|nr:unnamed protein product [Chilo suppressalis]
MSEDDVISAKGRLLELLTELNDFELDTIEKWICSNSYKKELEAKKKMKISEKCLIDIGETIKQIIPFEAEMPSENIVPPTVGDQADCNATNTCHIDEFLYDQDAVHELVKEGKLQRHYCLTCNSRNIKDLTLISHSMSRQALQYIFQVLLPKELEDKQVLDVGSRIGAVLYGAYYFSRAGSIVGIEMNKECCDVQQRIINQYAMDNNRIKVINSDVMERSDVVQNSDVIIINVLDFFVDIEKHKQMWYFFKKYIKKGSYLVCNRSMADTLGYLDMFEELMDWLSICNPSQLENEVFFDVEDCSELFLYTVN